MAGGRAIGLVLVAFLGGSAQAGTSLRPDLVETTVEVVQQGSTLRVTDAVRNRGRATAPSSTTGFYLAQVRIGGRPVGTLRAGSSSRAATKLAVPRSIAPGSYRLRVCADDRSRVHEADERNNCRSARLAVAVPDRTPPRFAGLTQATTCIPGPAGGEVRSSHYSVKWAPAADDATPASGIVYDIYQAAAPGGEDFSTPTYTTAPGATSFATPLLPDDSSYYFVVRARDAAGNRDANAVERRGMNLCV
jgi:CARDB